MKQANFTQVESAAKKKITRRERFFMKISVIMTVKNGQSYIGKSIDSIIRQTYPVFEIVVVDDGSSDDTLLVLHGLVQSFDNIIIIRTTGVGRSQALNLAIKKSSGDWIANLDVDDLWHPDKLRLQANEVSKISNINIISTGTEIIYDDDAPNFENFYEGVVDTFNSSNFYSDNKVCHSSVLMSRELLDNVGGYNFRLNKQVDLDLWYRILNNGYLIYNVPVPLTAKRIHKNQSYENKNRLRYITHSVKMTFSFLKNNKAPFRYHFLNFLRFFYHFLPFYIRNYLGKVIKPKL